MNKHKISYLVFGILSILVSLIAFCNPGISAAAFVIVFAVMAIVKGIFELFVRRKMTVFPQKRSGWIIVLGIVDILIGLFLLFNLSTSILALPYCFAIWFLFDSIFELILSSAFAQTSYFWVEIVLSILGIIVGIFLLAHPLTAFFTFTFLVGMYFMLIGLMDIIYAFHRE